MSYLFDGSNDTMTGTMASAYAGELVTMAFKMKVTAHPLATDYMLSFGNSSSSIDDAHKMFADATDNSWIGRTTDTTPASADTQITGKNVDGVWSSFVYRISSASLRDLFIDDIGTTAQTTATRNLTDGLKYVMLGSTFTGLQDFTGRLAEVAIWNYALSDSEITDYMDGTPASSIQPSYLIGYWPLNYDNATQANEGVDTGGDLTVTGAVYDADHPALDSNPSISAAPSEVAPAFNYTVTGTGFGASQGGAGNVYIAPTDSVADANKVTQTIVSWSDTSITFTATRGSLGYNTNMYLFVKEDGGTSNASGSVLQFKPGITLSWSA